MPQEMIGRRVNTVEEITQPGDYCGPIKGHTADKLAVIYLLPVARDPDVHGEGRSVHHVVSPPHVFTEEPDGTLTIRESIGAMPHWHGYLTRGKWQLTRG